MSDFSRILDGFLEASFILFVVILTASWGLLVLHFLARIIGLLEDIKKYMED